MANQNWAEKNGRAWMGKSALNPPPPPKKIVKGPPPPPRTPPTFSDWLAWAGKGMANVGGAVNQAVGETAQAVGRGAVYAGEVANRVGQVAGKAYNNVAGSANRFMQAESQATQPIRDEEAEAAWNALQYYNYFYGLPYATISYKEHMRLQQLRLNQPSAPATQPAAPAAPNSPMPNNPQSYAEYKSGAAQMPPPPAPAAQSWAQQLDKAGGASPAAQTALTQPQINMQWLDYWNGRGPRPAAGTIYQP